MDGFPTLPLEIARLILVEAVRVRGLKRATRLRFVSQSWNREVPGAIFESGILEGLRGLEDSSLWPNYLMFRTMRKGARLPRPLRIIRQVAERVLAFRGENNSDDVLRQYVLEICQLIPKCIRGGGSCLHWLKVPERNEDEGESIDEDDKEFKEALLAAAVATNDIALVKQILPVAQDCLHLISQHGWRSHSDPPLPIIGYPLDVAACVGHVEALCTLLAALKDPFHLELARGEALECAANQIEILELCLEPVYPSHDPELVALLEYTTNIEIFTRVLSLCKDHLEYDFRLKPNQRLDELLPEFLSNRFHVAAKRGELTMMKHLVQLGVKPQDSARAVDMENYYYKLISQAAAGGHIDVIAYLLGKGVTIGSRSLEAACKHGNSDCVKLLLEHGATDDFKPGSAVLECVNRENELVLRQLIESGMTIDDKLKRHALEITEKEGLESMAKMIKEFEIVGS